MFVPIILFANMKVLRLLVSVFLLCATSCSPPASSAFLAGFNPSTTLSHIGSAGGITYFKGSSGSAASKDLFSGLRIDKDWTLSFEGSQSQLLDQLDRFRAEIERQLSSNGASISGRGRWTGDFSGFSFEYTAGSIRGFIRVTGVSFESGRQGLDILAYEH